MFSIPGIVKDITDRAVSTGWQAAAGAVIAQQVFHDPSLTALVAAGLSVAKVGVVWFYTNHKTEVTAVAGELVSVESELKPYLEELSKAIAGLAAAPAPVVVTPPVGPALKPAVLTGSVAPGLTGGVVQSMVDAVGTFAANAADAALAVDKLNSKTAAVNAESLTPDVAAAPSKPVFVTPAT